MTKLFTSLACLVAASVVLASSSPKSSSLVIDTQHSSLTIHVWKQGLFSFAADNHVVDAPIASGKYDAAHQTIELSIDAAKLRVLDPQLAPNRRDQVQANMVGPQVLDVQKYPQIVFRSTKSPAGSPSQLSITGDLTLHGQTHPIVVQTAAIDATHFKGTATVRQTDFGITPIRLAGGTVKVKDDVNIDFELALKPAQ